MSTNVSISHEHVGAELFARLSALFDVGVFADMEVLVAGCGSGGGLVALQLVMSGVKHFTLIDQEVLEIENVIRHVCGRRYLGQPKTTALADVLRDRNPNIVIREHQVDLQVWKSLEQEIHSADVVVLATDNDPTRFLVNELCVTTQTPFVVGRVFTRGIGGEVFAYRPSRGGCLACLEGYLERNTQFRHGVREIDLLSEKEREEKLYGLHTEEIKDSPGLSVDIGFIAAFHSRFVLDALGEAVVERPRFLLPIDENYVVWGNRAVSPFKKNFQLQRITLRRQADCRVCGDDFDRA